MQNPQKVNQKLEKCGNHWESKSVGTCSMSQLQ